MAAGRLLTQKTQSPGSVVSNPGGEKTGNNSNNTPPSSPFTYAVHSTPTSIGHCDVIFLPHGIKMLENRPQSTNYFASFLCLLPCITNEQCRQYHGECIKDFCKCNNTFNCKLSSANTLVNKLGEKCTETSDCNIDSAFCDDKKNECLCKDGYIPSENKMKCLRTATGLGDDCEEAAQCYSSTPSSGCHQKKCACQQHMHDYNGSCYKNVALGETCQLIGECSVTIHATCVKTKCQCRENYVSNGSACLLKANGINFTCNADLQCRAQLGEGAECSNGSCSCQEVFHFKPSTNQCVHDVLLNEQCGDNKDCHQPGTGPSRLECIIGVCKCKSPYLEEGGFCINSSTSVVVIRSFLLFLGTMFLII